MFRSRDKHRKIGITATARDRFPVIYDKLVREARNINGTFTKELCTQMTMCRRCDYNSVDRALMTTIITAEIAAPLKMK